MGRASAGAERQASQFWRGEALPQLRASKKTGAPHPAQIDSALRSPFEPSNSGGRDRIFGIRRTVAAALGTYQRRTVVIVDMNRTSLILAMVAVAGLAACSSGSPKASTSTMTCRPPAGGRCAGPAPVPSWLYGPLALAADGRTISGRFQCGGRLAATETAAQVRLTFIASSVGTGGLSCALESLNVQLHGELGSRAVIDGVTHQALSVQRG
jgi:hypothetical protein